MEAQRGSAGRIHSIVLFSALAAAGCSRRVRDPNVALRARRSATASEWARLALDAAARSESPFRQHRKLGLVDRVEPDVLARLRELAASTSR